MNTFKHILLTTDFSKNAEAALPYAVALAKQSGGTIHLFHAIANEVGDALAAGIPTGVLAWRTTEQQQQETRLNDLAKLIAEKEVKVSPICVYGNPAIQAIKAAQDVHADLVVLSTRGRTGLAQWFLGSVAEKIVRLSPIPVLTIRPEAHTSSVIAFNTVLVPTDFSENSEKALPLAIEMARQNGGKLLLVHVIEDSVYYPAEPPNYFIGPEAGAWMRYVKEGLETQLAAAAKKLAAQSEMRVETALESGQAAEQIAGIARKKQADLIVLATHGRTGFSHLLSGSVAERVVRSST